MRRLVLGMAGAAVLAGCAASARSGLAEGDAPPGKAQQLADVMAAAASGDGAAVSRAVQVIDRLGAHPLEGAGEDPVGAWRVQAAVTTPPLRGRPLGPGYRSGRIPAGGSESFAQLFLSGTGATIALSAPNGGRVAMRVIDPSAKTVCKGEANRGGTCRWVPLFTQRYTIEVANLGSEDVRYFLVVE